jgi:hypothetical protein
MGQYKNGQSRETGNNGYIGRRQTQPKQSRETDNIGYTGRRQTQPKHNTLDVGHHFAQPNINNVNKI